MVKRKKVRYEIRWSYVSGVSRDGDREYRAEDPMRLDTRDEGEAYKEFKEWCKYNERDVESRNILVDGLYRVKPGRAVKIAP